MTMTKSKKLFVNIKKKMHEKPYESVVKKAISWRTVGTIDTIVVSYFITGNLVMAASIGSIEVITKWLYITSMKEHGINYLWKSKRTSK